MWLSEWHFEQRIFDIINDSLPDRYKTKLENRSYREGASVEARLSRNSGGASQSGRRDDPSANVRKAPLAALWRRS
jgi:hypothetical protein